ncbi:MAG: hypothetical protein CME21_01525 [Gemmatimonadetes bacterium]|jgi:hypothetical protein|nr:hypothetical protein [Gemmatimonadota bacterium]HCK08538.1 hypothetical protein [Candidatus Latescibacterota bacterium]
MNTYKLENPISVSYLQDNLRDELPRLVLTRELEANLRNRLDTDPVVQNVYKAIKLNAEQVFEESIINLDIPMEERSQDNQLDISRDLLLRINVLAMVYRIENDRRMLGRIDEEVIAACNFPSWNPKHFLDVGEMCLGIAMAVDWVGPDLPASTVELAKQSLIEKGIDTSWPEDGKHPHWAYGHNNWNQVCHGGLVAASLAIAEVDPELAAKTIHRAIDGMANALDSYGPDGVYPEGATYWGYGTSFSVVTAAMFESAFGTDFGILEYPGFKESAVFRMLCDAPSGLLYNFCDCGETSGKAGDTTLAWFATKTGNKRFLETEKFTQDPESMGRFSRLAGLSLVWMSQFEEASEEDLPTAWKGDGLNPIIFFRGGVYDPNKYYLGCKGGRGRVSHGNMDGGSFVFELDGVRWSIDPGMTGRYGRIERTGFGLWDTRQEGDRWKLLNKGNFGHSTITVNDRLHDVEGKAEIIDYKPGDRPEAVIDMTAAFFGELKRARRTFIKDSERSLLIEDDIEKSDTVDLITWQLITQADVEILLGGAILKQDGKQLSLEVASHPELMPSVVSLNPPPLELDTMKDGLKRLELRFPAWTIKKDTLSIRVRLSGESL